MYTSNSCDQPNAQIIRILWRQQQELLKKSPDCVKPIINVEDPLDIQADIEGPKGTPYEGGLFRVKLYISGGFPQVAPKGYFLTKIYHPNVSEKGEICVNTLKKDWNPRQWSLYNLFEVIKCLLIVPFPESSLNEEAGKIFMENYDEYCKIAKIYTSVHAIKKSEQCCNTNLNSFQNNQISINNGQSINTIQNSTCSFNPLSNFNQNLNGQIKPKNIPFRRSQTVNIDSNNLYCFNRCINNQNQFNTIEKPKLGSLPFMRSNSNKEDQPVQNINRFVRSSSILVNNNDKVNSNDEINKWLMRI